MTEVSALLATVQSAAPTELPEILAAYAAAELGASYAELRLVDYRQDGLHIVSPTGRAPVAVRLHPVEPVESDTAAAVAFRTQQRVTTVRPSGETVMTVPVTVRAERLGTMTLVLGASSPATAGEAIHDMARVLAYCLLEVGKGTDALETARRAARFTLPAEMQWQLLPGRAFGTPSFAIAGQLEPATEVAGDSFDWSSGDGTLWCSVTDASGNGQPATMASTLAVSALRNARRAGLPLAEQASLADQALYAEYGGRRHVSAVLLQIDEQLGEARAVDAGSPMLLRVREGSVAPLALEAELPLGMFDGTLYAPQPVDLRPGDRLGIISDGVLGVESAEGEVYGVHRAGRALQDTVTEPVGEAARLLIAALRAHRGSDDFEDDATAVVLDWHAVRRS